MRAIGDCIRHGTAGLALLLPMPAFPDRLVLPPSPLERNGPVEALYRLDRPLIGSGTLDLEWTDALGRTVDRRRLSVVLDRTAEIPFRLDLRHVRRPDLGRDREAVARRPADPTG